MMTDYLTAILGAIVDLAEDAEALAEALDDAAHPYDDEMARDLALTMRGWERRYRIRLDQLNPPPVAEPEPPASGVPEGLTAFVLVGEDAGTAKARLAARWQELTHLLQMALADSDQAHEHTVLSAHQGWLTS